MGLFTFLHAKFARKNLTRFKRAVTNCLPSSPQKIYAHLGNASSIVVHKT